MITAAAAATAYSSDADKTKSSVAVPTTSFTVSPSSVAVRAIFCMIYHCHALMVIAYLNIALFFAGA